MNMTASDILRYELKFKLNGFGKERLEGQGVTYY